MTIIRLNRGTTLGTIDLNDGVNYALLEGWAPRVARRRTNQLGARPPFEDVLEQIPIRVYSKVSASAALAALHALTVTLEQAWSWWQGGSDNVVLLEYQPDGSALSGVLQAAVLGGDGLQNDLLDLAPVFNRDIRAWEINPVTLPILRRGAWLGAAESAVSSSTNVADTTTATFTSDADIVTPISIKLAQPGAWAGTAGYKITQGFLLLADSATKINAVEGESLTGAGTGGTWSTPADATYHARGGNVARFTATSTTADELGGFTITIPDKTVAVFAALRNNSASKTWKITVQATGPGFTDQRSKTVIIDASTTVPRVVFLGLVHSVQGVNTIDLIVQSNDSTGSPTIDFDYLTALGMDDETSRVVALDPVLEGSPALTANPYTLFDAAALTDPVPWVGAGDAAGARRPAQRYTGDAYLLSLGTDVVCFTMFNDGTNWRVYSGALMTFTMTVGRSLAYLIPQ